jgi:hypothetical protein
VSDRIPPATGPVHMNGAEPAPVDDISVLAVLEDSAPEAIDPAHSTHGDVGEAVAEEGISFSKRLRQPRTLISFGVSIVIIVLVVMRLNIHPIAVWHNIQTANPLLLLAAFAVYYLSFPVRALRWRIILRNAEYDREHGI